jgi:hypothetical protein
VACLTHGKAKALLANQHVAGHGVVVVVIIFVNFSCFDLLLSLFCC